MSLHKYWIRASIIKAKLSKATKKIGPKPSMLEVEIAEYYMQILYSLIYVVVEGWQELGLKEEKVDQFLENRKFVSMLKSYRNKTFHFQKSYFQQAHKNFYDEDGTAMWAFDLHKCLGEALLDRVKSQMPPELILETQNIIDKEILTNSKLMEL